MRYVFLFALLLLPVNSTTCPVDYAGPLNNAVQEWRINSHSYEADVGCDSGGLKQGRIVRFRPPLTGLYTLRVPTTCASTPIAMEVRQETCNSSNSELALGCATGIWNVELNSLMLQASQNYSLVLVANDSGSWQEHYYDVVQVGVEGSFGPKLASLTQPNLFEFSTKYGLSPTYSYAYGSPFLCEPGWYRTALMASFVPEVSGFYYVRVDSFKVLGWKAAGIMQIDMSECWSNSAVFCEHSSTGKLGLDLIYLYAGREYTVTIGGYDNDIPVGNTLAVGFSSINGGGDREDCLDFNTTTLTNTSQYQSAPLSLDHAYATEFTCEIGAITRPAQYVAFTPEISGNYFVRIAPASATYKGTVFLQVRLATCNGTNLGCATRVYSGDSNQIGKAGFNTLPLAGNTTYVFLAWAEIGNVIIETGLVNINATCTDHVLAGSDYGQPVPLSPSSYANLQITCVGQAYADAGFYTTIYPAITGNYYVYVANASMLLFGIEVRADSCQGSSVACGNATSVDTTGLNVVYLQSGARYVVLAYPLTPWFQSNDVIPASTIQIGYCGNNCKTNGPTKSPVRPSNVPTKLPTSKPVFTSRPTAEAEMLILPSLIIPPVLFSIVLCAVMVMCYKDQSGGTASLMQIRRWALFCALMTMGVFTTGWAVLSNLASYVICVAILICAVLLRQAAKTTQYFAGSYFFTKPKLIRNTLGLLSMLLLAFGALAFLQFSNTQCPTCMGEIIFMVYALINGVVCVGLAVSATILGVLFHNAVEQIQSEAVPVAEAVMPPANAYAESLPVAQVVLDPPAVLLSAPTSTKSIVCQRCQTATTNRTLHRCGHTLCTLCATEVTRKGKRCPFCDAPIEDVIAHF